MARVPPGDVVAVQSCSDVGRLSFAGVADEFADELAGHPAVSNR